ncbi:cation:proton antiporter [Actinokineospora sp.]|uniref:cation:proton antiporter n=1 Tax=Actinokineospora sp. TaxID=1872133 RepID=UPI004037CB54
MPRLLPDRSRRRHLAIYLLLVVVPVGLTLVGLSGVPSGGEPAPDAGAGGTDTSYKLILTIAVVTALAHGAGLLAARLGQPRVVGQMLSGLLLGPPVLGALAPAAREWLIPEQIVGSLGILAQLGVIFFMFLVGLDLPMSTLRRSGRAALTIGHAGVTLPFLCGVALGHTLLADLRPDGVDQQTYALFCGLAMSITAVPVLAKILAERGLLTGRTGVLGIASAGIGDVTAWCVLALVLAMGRRADGVAAIALTVGLVAVFGLVMVLVVRPALARLLARPGRRETVAVGLLLLVLLSAWSTHEMGVHAVFGAFLAGVVMPRGVPAVGGFALRLDGVTHWLLLPLFFASVGLRLSPDALDSGRAWLTAGVVVVVAMAAKFAATVAAARGLGIPWRESMGLGVMMNCRGLTEIIILDIGVSAGLITGELFTIMVLMALVTTMVTGPLLSALRLGAAERAHQPV